MTTLVKRPVMIPRHRSPEHVAAMIESVAQSVRRFGGLGMLDADILAEVLHETVGAGGGKRSTEAHWKELERLPLSS